MAHLWPLSQGRLLDLRGSCRPVDTRWKGERGRDGGVELEEQTQSNKQRTFLNKYKHLVIWILVGDVL